MDTLSTIIIPAVKILAVWLLIGLGAGVLIGRLLRRNDRRWR